MCKWGVSVKDASENLDICWVFGDTEHSAVDIQCTVPESQSHYLI